MRVGDNIRFRDFYIPEGLEIPKILDSRVIIHMRPGEDSVLGGDDSDDEDSESGGARQEDQASED
jgi:hypothetical protein